MDYHEKQPWFFHWPSNSSWIVLFFSDFIIELIKDEALILSSIMSIVFWVLDMVIPNGIN